VTSLVENESVTFFKILVNFIPLTVVFFFWLFSAFFSFVFILCFSIVLLCENHILEAL